MDRFSAFEGNTGPYILYTIVRIGSILNRCGMDAASLPLRPAELPQEKDLQLLLSRFADQLQLAARDSAPNVLCAYCYDLAGAANRFYHDVRILQEPDQGPPRGLSGPAGRDPPRAGDRHRPAGLLGAGADVSPAAGPNLPASGADIESRYNW